MINPDFKDNQGYCNSYVAKGKTRAERRARLDEVPEDLKEYVRHHIETIFAIRKFHRENKK